MLLAKLYVAQPGAHIGGTYKTLLQASEGYRLVIRKELQGVVASHERTGEVQWIPFAACRNGVLMPVDKQDDKPLG